MNSVIHLDKISKSYGEQTPALNQISLEVKKGEVLVLMGPSGSGKSTLIRTLNGLEGVDEGTIEVLGLKLTGKSKEKVIRNIRTKVGMVFQQFNLFPHLKVIENIMLAPIQIKKLDRQKAEDKALNLLIQMGIQDQSRKYPNQLSGGQQQRVAIARALAMEPEIMLFDEPTSALDPERVKEVLDAIKDLARKGMTMVIVTHEIGFAKEIADRVVFLDQGKVIEISTPEIFFNNAKHERSRKFLNQMM